MSEFINSYLKIIWEERFWSWSVIGILYLIAGWTVRGWFLNSLHRSARSLKSKYYHDVKQAYLRRSLTGWFFFFLPLIIFTYIWNQTAGHQLTALYTVALGVGILSFIVSILAHLRAFGLATLSVLGELVHDKERDLTIKSHP